MQNKKQMHFLQQRADFKDLYTTSFPIFFKTSIFNPIQ